MAGRVPPVVDVVRFDAADVTAWKAHLDEEGFAVVRGVLRADEIETAVGLFWDWAEREANARRDDAETWHDWPAAVDGGIFPWQGAGQSSFAWFVRSNRAVHDVFRQIWSTAELLVSFDAVCAWRPWGIDARWRPSFREADGGWFHCDQHPDRHTHACTPAHICMWDHFCRKELACVQGLVDCIGVDACGGGNTLVPRSHSAFSQWRRDYSARVDEFGGDS